LNRIRQKADHSEMDNTDTIIRYQGDRMVGFSILNASLNGLVAEAQTLNMNMGY